MQFTPPSRVDAPDFTLRVWSVEDSAALRTVLELSDAHLRAFTPWVVDGRVPGVSIEDRLRQHAEAFAAGTEWVYGMFSPTRSSPEVFGACGLYPRLGPGVVELGYWLAVTHTGRGLATQAAATLTRLAFTDPTIDRVEIHCDPRNTPSNRVPRRLGYATEPTVSSAGGEIDGEGAHHELAIWSLTRTKFAAQSTEHGSV